MTSSDDILNQIDGAVADYDVSVDAMRSQPAALRGAQADVYIVDEAVDRPRPALSWEARQLLIRRLMDNHGLSRMTARHAILAVEQGRDSRHADLVRSEARAAMQETLQRVNEAMQPALEAAATAVRALAEAFKRAFDGIHDGDWVDSSSGPVPSVPFEDRRSRKPRRPRDRPAWQSPHGPAHRRR